MQTAPIPEFPVSPQTAVTTELPRVRNWRRWHKRDGINREPLCWELHMPGVKECICWEWPGRIEIIRLLVFRRWQGRGVGGRVLRHLQGLGKPLDVFPVSDDYRQADLERFYHRHGFRPCADGDLWTWTPILKSV